MAGIQESEGTFATEYADGFNASKLPKAGSSSSKTSGVDGLVRDAPQTHGKGWGKGVVPVDPRKFKYDVLRAQAQGALTFSATKADIMDASDAGALLDNIHRHYGIAAEQENRILAFDEALWYQHTINGASQLQPGRGSLFVDGVAFDIQPIKNMLGVDARRFFRAYADVIADNNRRILAGYDEYDFLAKEKAARINMVATKRGLAKFPHLAHDSAEAGENLSQDERVAVLASKPYILPSVDVTQRAADQAGRSASAAKQLGGEAEL